MKTDEDYYIKDKLNEKDRSEIEFWENMIYQKIDDVLAEFELLNDIAEGKAKYEVAAEFAETLTEYIRGGILEYITSIIERYDNDDE